MGIINALNTRLQQFFLRLRTEFIGLNKKIRIGKSNKIYSRVQFVINYGGEINIGNNNEFLFGVCLMTYGGSIRIGDNCSINPYTIIYGHGKGTIIGDNVLIAGHCMIIPSNHIYNDINIPINKQGEKSKGIVIEDDVWLGTGVKILDGVKIGKGAIVAAGAVVNSDVPSYSVYAGIPAKKIKERK